MNQATREHLRVRLGPDPQRSAAIADSQSLKNNRVAGEERGYDSGNKPCGRNCYLLVITEGFVLKVKVNSAKIMDCEGIKLLIERAGEQVSRL